MDQTTPEQTHDSAQNGKVADRTRFVTGFVCVACVLVFLGLLQEREPDSWHTLSRYGYLPAVAIWSGKYWALLSSVFVHRELLHFVFNVYWLWALGGAMERAIGPLRLTAFVVTSAIVSSGIELAVSGSPGIGASGVGYAMFGFMWLARERVDEFKKTVPKQVVVLFFGWGVICILGTLIKTMHIANAAHISGLLFGAAVAMAFVLRKRVVLMAAGLGCLILVAVVPLFWCPWNANWASKQGYDAHLRHDYATAIGWYQRTIDLNGDSIWAVENMARAYRSLGNQSKYDEALNRLRLLDPRAAQQLEHDVADR